MQNTILSKLTRFSKIAFAILLLYPTRMFAGMQTKYGGGLPVQQELYGPVPLYGLQLPLYGPPPATWNLEKTLLIITIPLGILLAIAIGLLIYLKKRAKKNVKKNS